jgi:hypothetical protein
MGTRGQSVSDTHPVDTDPPDSEPVTNTADAPVFVWVCAYGRWRTGTVTARARTRVTVRYVRNARGQEHEKAFPLRDVRTRRPSRRPR